MTAPLLTYVCCHGTYTGMYMRMLCLHRVLIRSRSLVCRKQTAAHPLLLCDPTKLHRYYFSTSTHIFKLGYADRYTHACALASMHACTHVRVCPSLHASRYIYVDKYLTLPFYQAHFSTVIPIRFQHQRRSVGCVVYEPARLISMLSCPLFEQKRMIYFARKTGVRGRRK